MKTDSLPLEFAALSGKVQYVVKRGVHEWSSSCPQCGGGVHKFGEPPDRFRMWTNANGKNKVFGWCRKCSYFWMPDKDNKMNKEDFERWRSEQLVIEKQRKADAEKAIRLLQSDKLWERYHAGLTDWPRSIIREWGIMDDWADYWQLGFNPDYVVRNHEGEYHSPAITIPLWQRNGAVGNIKLRVLDPKSSTDRYRNVYKTGLPMFFWAYRNEEHRECLLVEGEKKAMVCAQYPSARDRYQVIGLNSVTPSEDLVRELDCFDRIHLILDPDARQGKGTTPQDRLIDILGPKRTRFVNLPGKVDDLIVKHGLSLGEMLRYETEVK